MPDVLSTAQATIDSNPEVVPQATINSGDIATNISPQTAANRASQVIFGNSNQGKSYDEVMQNLNAGQEEIMRQSVTADYNYKLTLAKNAFIRQKSDERGNKPFTREEIDMLNSEFDRRVREPNSVWELNYGSQFIDYLKTLYPTASAIPEADDTMEFGKNFIAIQQHIQNKYRENFDATEAQGYLERGWDITKNILPIVGPVYSYYHLRGFTETSAVSGKFLGNNLAEQAQAIYSLPAPEAVARINQIYDYLTGHSRILAGEWLSAMAGMSRSEQIARNFALPLEVLTLAAGLKTVPKPVPKPEILSGVEKAIMASQRSPVGFNPAPIGEFGIISDAEKAALRSTPSPVGITQPSLPSDILQKARGAVSNMAKTNLDPTVPPPVKAAEGLGDTTAAGVKKVADIIVKDMEGKSDPVTTSIENLHTFFRPALEGLTVDTGNLGREAAARIQDSLTRKTNNLIDLLMNGIRVERLPAIVAAEDAGRKALQATADYYPGIRNSIMDSKIRSDTSGINRYLVDFTIGKSGTELFDNLENAQAFANKYIKGATVEPYGAKYRIVATVPLRETDEFTRTLILANPDVKTPDSFINAIGGQLGKFRTPEETLSLYNRMQRHTATYVPNALMKATHDLLEDVNNLKSFIGRYAPSRRQKWQEWQRALDASLHIQTENGRAPFFRTIQEVESHWQQTLGRLPDEQEVAAYFSWQLGEELRGQVFPNLHQLRNKSRQGAQQWTVSFPETSKAGVGQKLTFEASKEIAVPNSEEPVLILKSHLGDSIVKQGKNIRGKEREYLNKDIADGKVYILKVTNPGERPLATQTATVGDARIGYVVARRAEFEDLNWNQVRRRPPTPEHEFTVGQAVVRRDPVSNLDHYEGDKTVSVHMNRVEARDFATKLDATRVLIQEGKEAEAEAFWNRNPIAGLEYKDVRGWFQADVTSEGLPIPSRYDLRNEFRVIPRGQLIGDIDNKLELQYGSRFRNNARSGYGGKVGDGVGDVFALRRSDTQDTPTYSIAEVKYVDPITSMNRSLTQLIHNHFLDDYKIMSVEHWIREARGLIRASDAELADAPFYHFYNPKWNNLTGEDAIRAANLKIANFHIRQLLGVQNENDTVLHAFSQKLSDSLYESGHSSVALLPARALPFTRDPTAFLRSAAFHAKMGFFAIPQLLQNMQQYVTIWGIAGPKFAGPGTAGATLHLFSRVNKNPEILAALDKIASKLGWRPGEFTEANEAYTRSGFNIVAGEYQLRDNPLKNDLITTPTKSFLDAGTWFFRKGEAATRAGAWYTAWREFRAVNPTVAIGNKELQQIMTRADLLWGNMSRASSSALTQGWMSLPSQFYSYTLRLSELFLGKRLSDVERVRLFGTYAAIYGVPVAWNLTGFPVSEYLNKWAQEDGYVPNNENFNNAMATLLKEGIPHVLHNLMTGSRYNYGEKFGASGFELAKDILRGDATLWNIIGGAAGGVVYNSIVNSDGFFRSMSSIIRNGTIEGDHPLKFADFADVFNEISSVSRFRQLWTALSTGRWLSRNEAFLSNVDKKSALYMWLTGVSQQSTQDLSGQSWSKKDLDKLWTSVEKEFGVELRRGLRADAEGDHDGAKQFYRRAGRILKANSYPVERRGQLMMRMSRDNEAIIKNADWQFYIGKDLPTDIRQQRQDAYKLKLRNQ